MAARRTPASTPDSPRSGTLYLVATPIGNLEDITYRAVRLLGEVDLIAAEDTRRTGTLLRHYQITTPTKSYHAHNEAARTRELLEALDSGRSIALVSDAGMPLISDPGARLVREAHALGIPVRVAPGPSAVIAAAAASGLVESSFVFVGFAPNRSKARKDWFSALCNEERPIIMFEAPHRIQRSLRDLLETMGDRQIALCRELTKIHEEYVVRPISEVIALQLEPRGEITVVISPNHRASSFDEMPAAQDIALEFGRLTEHEGLARRAAILHLAKKYGIRSRTVYQAIEEAKTANQP